MKKLFLSSAFALAVSAASSPACAADSHSQWINVESVNWGSLTTNPATVLVALLLPAIQAARG